MEIAIKENKLKKESAGYENVIYNILKFTESYLVEKGTQLPEDGKILVYISSVFNVHFIFENTPILIEVRFRNALNQFYKL